MRLSTGCLPVSLFNFPRVKINYAGLSRCVLGSCKCMRLNIRLTSAQSGYWGSQSMDAPFRRCGTNNHWIPNSVEDHPICFPSWMMYHCSIPEVPCSYVLLHLVVRISCNFPALSSLLQGTQGHSYSRS